MGVNLTIPAAFEDALSTPEQIEWLYRNKEALLQAGANIEISRQGDRTIITAKGEGFSPVVEVEEIPGGHQVTITDGEGPHTFYVMDGVDGTTPTVGITSITGGYRLTITNGTVTESVNIMNGVNGSDGADGDSIVVKSVDAVEGGVNVTVTDKNGDHVIFLMNGPQGLTGPAATIQVGSTTTGEPGSNASVTNVGTSSNAVFNFSIPAGADGQDGTDGTDGRNTFIKYADSEPSSDDDMKDVPSAWIGVYNGTASSAPAHYTSYQWYNIKGASGTDGTSATVTVGSTTTGQPGTSASVTNSGTTSAAILNFVIPEGQPGQDGADGSDGQDGADGADGEDGTMIWETTDDYTTPNYTFDIEDLSGISGKTPKVGDLIIQNVNYRTYVFKINTVDTTTVLTDYFCELTGATGATGQTGPAGPGVPTGGTAGQVLTKVDGTDYNAEWATPSGGGGSNETIGSWLKTGSSAAYVNPVLLDSTKANRSYSTSQEASSYFLRPGTTYNLASSTPTVTEGYILDMAYLLNASITGSDWALGNTFYLNINQTNRFSQQITEPVWKVIDKNKTVQSLTDNELVIIGLSKGTGVITYGTTVIPLSWTAAYDASAHSILVTIKALTSVTIPAGDFKIALG